VQILLHIGSAVRQDTFVYRGVPLPTCKSHPRTTKPAHFLWQIENICKHFICNGTENLENSPYKLSSASDISYPVQYSRSQDSSVV
jgi:hypothetical protein